LTRCPLDYYGGHVAAWLAETGKQLHPDRVQAEQFLRLLDPDAAFFSFRTFSDTPYTRAPGRDPLERAIHGPLDACWHVLVALNQAGAAVSVTVNATNRQGRGPGDIVCVRALFVDDDCPDRRSCGFPLLPHITIESSPGRYHRYWLTRACGLNEFSAFQGRLAAIYATDHKVCALNQSMALPGFWRRKNSRRWFRTTILHTEEGVPLGYRKTMQLLETGSVKGLLHA
jgi:hypothetical protein